MIDYDYLKRLERGTRNFLDLNPSPETLRIVISEEERIRQRFVYQAKSAEAKLERVDPFSEEFEETVDRLEDIKLEIEQRSRNILLLQHRLAGFEFATQK